MLPSNSARHGAGWFDSSIMPISPLVTSGAPDRGPPLPPLLGQLHQFALMALSHFSVLGRLLVPGAPLAFANFLRHLHGLDVLCSPDLDDLLRLAAFFCARTCKATPASRCFALGGHPGLGRTGTCGFDVEPCRLLIAPPPCIRSRNSSYFVQFRAPSVRSWRIPQEARRHPSERTLRYSLSRFIVAILHRVGGAQVTASLKLSV